MAITEIFKDGFEQYATGQADAIAAGWSFGTTSTSITQVSSAQAGYGNRSMFLSMENAATYWCEPPVSVNAATCGFAGYIYYASLIEGNTAATCGFHFYNGSTRLFSLKFMAGGVVSVVRPDGTVYNSAGGVVTAGSFHHVEMQINVHASTGYIKVWINGNSTPVINTGNINTGSTNVTKMRNGRITDPGAAYATYLDSLVFYTCAAGDSPYGDYHVINLKPNGDTATADWTKTGSANGYDCIDDVNPDGDTTYISSSTLNDTSIFDIESMPANYDNIKSVSVVSYVKKMDAGACGITHSIVQGVNTSNGTEVSPSTGYTYKSGATFTVDPTSGVAFTQSDIASLKLQIKRTT